MRNISAPMLPMPTEPRVLPTRPTPIWPALLAKPGGPSMVSWCLIRSLPVTARISAMMATATGRRTPSGVMTSAMSLSVQAGTSTLS